MEFARKVIVSIVIITILIFLLYHLFTDPVGSAHAIKSLVLWIADKIGALFTFGSSF